MKLSYTVRFIFALSMTRHLVDSIPPNLCDVKGTLQCENYQTCCQFSDSDYGCCPFTAANCCPLKNSCCPAGFQCGETSCIRMNTNSKQGFQ
ncbi:granulin [Dictyocaulus viviparus]|uniref:Granulin n=1 Tax=Dictyocaulus viviparus TaxID=29172 RepID=A0A0D8XQT1_DICVI|nr:granulin [Dictyocaulus viviparus]